MRCSTIVGCILALGIVALGPRPAWAVFSGEMSPRPPSSDVDYAEAIEAKAAGDHVRMINNLLRVVDRRPWHDNAHSLLGFGYRQLGRYDRALEHYAKALDHNPHHRGALEYMGVTYLHIGDRARAVETRATLLRVCRKVALTFSDGAFGTGCEEYEMLDEVIRVYDETGIIIDCE
jgi:tetratricopeptide (TPR) repeat protein